MEKDEILKCHENFIQATYLAIREYTAQNMLIDKEIELLEEELRVDNNLAEFYCKYASLMADKTLNQALMEIEKRELLISRTRIFYELGLITDDERNATVKDATHDLVQYYDLEYKLRLIELASKTDTDSDDYIKLVDLISYYRRDKGAVLKSLAIKKDI